MNDRRRKLGFIWVTGSLAAVALAVWVWHRMSYVQESAAPDRFDLGSVASGSIIELSARFLTSAGQTPLEKLHQRLQNLLPRGWSPLLDSFDPAKLRQPLLPSEELSALQPEIDLPAFLRLDRVTPDQRAAWYAGQPFFVLHLALQTDEAGDYSGEIHLRWDRRRAALPIHYRVTAARAERAKLLVATTPYQSDTTEDGAVFKTAARLLSELSLDVDCRHTMPPSLAAYRAILLSEECLADLSEADVVRVRGFAAGGGRVILACNAFMVGTVAAANAILEGHGLRVVDADHAREAEVTRLAADPLTRGVQKLWFFRPSLIKTLDSEARGLAWSQDEEGAFIAVRRLHGGGEIIVLGASMWWNWIREFETDSDNFQMMKSLLNGTVLEKAE